VHLNIEIVCTDADEHRNRVESRPPEVAGLRLPTWEDVQSREYHEWRAGRLVIDTAGRTADESRDELVRRLAAMGLIGGAGTSAA